MILVWLGLLDDFEPSISFSPHFFLPDIVVDLDYSIAGIVPPLLLDITTQSEKIEIDLAT